MTTQKNEIDSLKSLWKKVFGDDDEFVDYYFSHYHSSESCVSVFQDSQAISSLHSHDFLDGNMKGSYIYGVATLQSHRGGGLARHLMVKNLNRLFHRGVTYAMLIAQEESLRQWYGTMDFVLRKDILSVRGEIDDMNFGMDDSSLNVGMYRVVNIEAHMQRYAQQNPSRYSLFGVEDTLIPDNTGLYSVKDGKVIFFPGKPDFASISPARVIESFPIPYIHSVIIPSTNDVKTSGK